MAHYHGHVSCLTKRGWYVCVRMEELLCNKLSYYHYWSALLKEEPIDAAADDDHCLACRTHFYTTLRRGGSGTCCLLSVGATHLPATASLPFFDFQNVLPGSFDWLLLEDASSDWLSSSTTSSSSSSPDCMVWHARNISGFFERVDSFDNYPRGGFGDDLIPQAPRPRKTLFFFVFFFLGMASSASSKPPLVIVFSFFLKNATFPPS